MQTKSLLILIAFGASLALSAQTKYTFPKGHSKKAPKGYNKTTNEYLPQTTANFYWDDLDANWVPSDSQITQYDSKGNTLQVESRYNGNFGNLTKYTYDANDRQIGAYSFNWNSMTSKWDSSSKAFTSYDAQGTELEYIYYGFDWLAKDWARGYGYKNQNVYDGTGKLTEQTSQEWVNHLNSYRNDYKGLYVYDAEGKPNLFTQMDWDTVSNTFKNEMQATNIVWHKWIPNNLESSLPSSFTFKAWVVLAWVNASKQTSTYDANDNITEEKSETWSGLSWELESIDKTIYTYDANSAMTSSIEQSYDLDSAKYFNNYKSIYSNFFVFSSLNEKTLSQSDLNVFPNPMNTEATISINQKSNTGKCELKLYNILGIMVNSQTIENGKATLEKGNLSNGVYFYQLIENNQAVANGKLIIE